jgi:uncharacterized protein YbjT (DUF2867 family)
MPGWVVGSTPGTQRLLHDRTLAEVRHAPVATADQARVIAAILQNPDPHDRQIYPLFGVEELDWYAIAAKVNETLGIPVRYEPIEISTFAPGLTAAGASPILYSTSAT